MIHLYGVTAPDAPPPEVTGRQEQDVRVVSDGSLGAIVSDVDVGARIRRQDLLAHAHVLEWYAAEHPVVPVQFGVALPDEDAVRRDVLEQQGESLRELLDWFDGLVQVTVSAQHYEEPALVEVMRREPELVRLRDELSSFPDLQDRQVQLGQAVAGALEELEAEDRAMLLDELAPLARAVAEQETEGAHEVLNAAFLVERGSRGAFDAAVGELRAKHEELMQLRYVGPQPPYSFLEPVRNGELVWD